MTAYRPVPPQVDLPALEREVLDLWESQQTFARSVELTRDEQPWTFYEGPPTANGMPGTHHVEARVFKDVFPRFQTMRRRYVARKGGWDCHGRPSSWPSRRSSASPARVTSRPSGSPSSTPAAGSRCCATSAPSSR